MSTALGLAASSQPCRPLARKAFICVYFFINVLTANASLKSSAYLGPFQLLLSRGQSIRKRVADVDSRGA